MATVLVIDDDESLRRAICRGLRQAGHEVLEADDGRKGLARAKRDRPNLVITDIVMPDQDGIETIVELRRLSPSPAVIAMSGMTGAAGFTPLDDAKLFGADAALRKPFSMDDLLAAVAKLLGTHTAFQPPSD